MGTSFDQSLWCTERSDYFQWITDEDGQPIVDEDALRPEAYCTDFQTALATFKVLKAKNLAVSFDWNAKGSYAFFNDVMCSNFDLVTAEADWTTNGDHADAGQRKFVIFGSICMYI